MSHRLALPEEAFLLVKGLDCTAQPLAPCTVRACLSSIALQDDVSLAPAGDMRLKAKFEAAAPVLDSQAIEKLHEPAEQYQPAAFFAEPFTKCNQIVLLTKHRGGVALKEVGGND